MHAMYIMDIVILSAVASCAARLQIIVNPPFVGARLMSATQKDDLGQVFVGMKIFGNLDYVSGWYRVGCRKSIVIL